MPLQGQKRPYKKRGTAEEQPKSTASLQRSPISGLATGGQPACRIDGAPLEHGECPSCKARAQRFLNLEAQEHKWRQRKVKRCTICHAPGAKSSKTSKDPHCQLCRKLLRREQKVVAALKSAA